MSAAIEEKRQPWMKWYPADWRADPGLRMCGYAARGLWADMLTLMHEATPYGHLLVNGKAPTPRQLAGLLGGSAKDVEEMLAELSEAGVYSTTEAGVIFSRRMVRDRQKQQEDREHGRRGGNPGLKGQSKGGDNPPPKPPGKPDGKPGGLTAPVNPPVTPPDKAQMLEARGQSSEANASGAIAPPVSRETTELELVSAGSATPPPEPDVPLWLVRIDGGDYSLALFRQGLTFVAESLDEPPAKCRPLIGRWLKDCGDDHKRLWSILVEAQRDNRADLKSWVPKAIQQPRAAAKTDDWQPSPAVAAIMARRNAKGAA